MSGNYVWQLDNNTTLQQLSRQQGICINPKELMIQRTEY